MVAPIITKLAEKYDGKVVIGKCDVEENEELASEFGIRNIPTILLFKDGDVIEKIVGAQTEAKLDEMIQKLL
jgi:thioredoxin 1